MSIVVDRVRLSTLFGKSGSVCGDEIPYEAFVSRRECRSGPAREGDRLFDGARIVAMISALFHGPK
jgi:hypothetical protein